MKTLYDKLSEENKLRIELRMRHFPLLYAELLSKLKSNTMASYLTINMASDVYFCIYDNSFDLYEFLKLFDNE